MRPNLLWVLLAVSLVANVFFAGGALYAFFDHREHEGRQVSRMLDLSPEQKQGLKALRDSVASRRAAMPESHGGLRAAMLAEIGKPAFNRDEVSAMLQEWSASRRTYFLDVAQDLYTYVATLSPEQQQKFMDLAQDRSFLRRLLRGRR